MFSLNINVTLSAPVQILEIFCIFFTTASRIGSFCILKLYVHSSLYELLMKYLKYVQEMIRLMREKRLPAAFKCYHNFHKVGSISNDDLFYKMVIHVHSDSAFRRYQKEMRSCLDLHSTVFKIIVFAGIVKLLLYFY